MDSPWQAGRLTVGRRPQVMFGRMYEDHGVELAVFPPGSRVLAIASAGDTVAALARAGHRVTAVDVNRRQLGYARARLAGAPTVTGTAERILGFGRAAAAAALPGWRPAALARFLRLTDPAEQRDWWQRELDFPALRILLALALRPVGPLAAILHRGLRDAIAPRLDLTLRRRIAEGVAQYPNATNPWAWRLLLGRDPTDPGTASPTSPPLPTTRSLATSRPLATSTLLPTSPPLAASPPLPTSPLLPTSRIEWVHADVLQHLRQAPASWYDAVTLSNVLDGPPPEYAARLHEALRHAVRPGGSVLLRTFRDQSPLAGRPLPDRALLWGTATQVEIGD